jgi:exopolysaccharide biosynthesis polyprenyl glycosylphosphotransferase
MGAFVRIFGSRVAPVTRIFSRSNAPQASGTSRDVPRVLPSPLFLRLLSLERKRSERSRQPFVLMLVEGKSRIADVGAEGMLGRALAALCTSIRETDIAGWYDSHSFGVIFAELGAAEKLGVIEALQARLMAALRSALEPEQVEQLQIAFHWFPEEWKDRENGHAPAAAMYRDLAQREEARKVTLAIKRGVDLAGSALALVVLLPLLAAIALAIKLTSPGPVIFRQERLGRHGRLFTLFKFRSMHAQSDATPHVEFIKRFIAGTVETPADGAAGGVVYKLTKDPRITPVGRFLRRTSLDELPQLFNVLRGEMSLVGPRPPIPYELESYDVWHRRRVLEAKPGITGLWQVTGRSLLRFDDMVRLDLEYARVWSLWLDLKILLRTARVVLSRAGAH